MPQAGIISGTLNKFGTTGLRVWKPERKPLIGHEVTRWAGRKLRHPALSREWIDGRSELGVLTHFSPLP